MRIIGIILAAIAGALMFNDGPMWFSIVLGIIAFFVYTTGIQQENSQNNN